MQIVTSIKCCLGHSLPLQKYHQNLFFRYFAHGHTDRPLQKRSLLGGGNDKAEIRDELQSPLYRLCGRLKLSAQVQYNYNTRKNSCIAVVL